MIYPAESLEVAHWGGETPVDLVRGANVRQKSRPHLHDTFALGAVDAGAARVSYEKHVVEHSRGDVIVIEPRLVHGGEAAAPEGWSYRMLYVPADLLTACVESVGGRGRFARPAYTDPAMAARVIGAHDVLSGDADVLLKESVLTETLRAVCARYRDGREMPVAAATTRALLRVRDYLDEHYAARIRITDLAQVMGVSQFHLIRQFRRAFGLPPYAYLELIRVNRARVMLQQGARISDTAFASGFSDQSHLTRRFKRAFGFTPGRYARSCAADRVKTRRR